MYGRDGKISAVRIATIIAVIGVLVVAAGVVSFFLDQNSHKVPLDIPLFPGAVNVGEKQLATTTRKEYYRVTAATPDEVAAFYNQRLYEHNGSQDEKCIRNPPSGDFDIQGIVNGVPFEYICMFDRSGFRTSQYTKVTIQPGIDNPDPKLSNAGMTIVEYEQYWQP